MVSPVGRPPKSPDDRPGRRADADDEGSNRRTASLAALVIALLLIVGAIYVARALHRNSVTEDCLMAHRLNCDAAATGHP